MMGPDQENAQRAENSFWQNRCYWVGPQIVTERKRQKLITISRPLCRHKRVPGQFEFIVQLPFPERVVIIQFISDFTQPQLGLIASVFLLH